jgi:hypothetical protein
MFATSSVERSALDASQVVGDLAVTVHSFDAVFEVSAH